MNKRKQGKIPRREATAEMIQAAGQIREAYIAATEMLEGDMLVLTVWETKGLRKGERGALFRTFMEADDYITQDLTTAATRWRTANFYNMRFDTRTGGECNQIELFSERYRDGYWHYKSRTFFWTDQDQERILNFLEKFQKKESRNVWELLERYQGDIQKQRLEERHRKETDQIDRRMETVQEIPQGFGKWAFNTALRFSRYLVYDAACKKDNTLGKCTQCQGLVTIDRTKTRIRHNEKGICPVCGSSVTYKAKGIMEAQITDGRSLVLIEPKKDGFLWRTFWAERRINRELLKPQDHLHEYKREFYTFDGDGTVQKEAYEFREYKNTGKIRWSPDLGYYADECCILYPDNLPQAWEHTPLRYSALEILSRNNPDAPADYRNFNVYRNHPALEWVIKMGFNKLAMQMLDYYDTSYHDWRVKLLNEKGKNIFEVLQLTKENARILQMTDGGKEDLRILQEAQRYGCKMEEDTLVRYQRIFGNRTRPIRERNASVHKICRYIERQSRDYEVEACSFWQSRRGRSTKEEQKLRSCGMDWIDYIGWCKDLGYDLTDTHVYFPKDIGEAHDRAYREWQEMTDEREKKKKTEEERELKKRMEHAKELLSETFGATEDGKGIYVKGKNMILVIPETAKDIREEGKALHHCVATYIGKVAAGATCILFVRRAEEPETPFYTLEYKDGEIIQCRGAYNREPTSEVRDFIKTFKEKENAGHGRRTKTA